MKTISHLYIVTNREIPANQQNEYIRQLLKMRCVYGIYEDLIRPNTVVKFTSTGNIDFSNPTAVVPVLVVADYITNPDDIDKMTFGDFSDGSSNIRGCIAALFTTSLETSIRQEQVQTKPPNWEALTDDELFGTAKDICILNYKSLSRNELIRAITTHSSPEKGQDVPSKSMNKKWWQFWK